MRITCISDLHGEYPELPGGDLLLIAGDLTSNDSIPAWLDFERWIVKQNYSKKVIIAGNHDVFCQNSSEHCMWKYWDKVGVTYLCDSGCEFEGLKIWGSPWTKTFEGMNPHCMAFTVPYGCDTEDWLKEKWDLIPEDTNILITHSPPYAIQDQTKWAEHVGSRTLRKVIGNLPLKLLVFGHIHEEYGQIQFKKPGYGTENNFICINASHMNAEYEPLNPPISLELSV